MRIRSRSTADFRILDLEGDLTLGAGDLALRGEFQQLLDQGHRKFLLNLDGVDRVDSAGLAEMIACKKRVKDLGGDLKLLKPRKKVQDLLLMSHLTEIFEIYQDESEAVESP